METAGAGPSFLLGDWHVEPSLNRVSRGGTVRHLRPRLMDLLVFMAGRAGEVVTKDAILQQVWRQRFVAESVLSRSVADLRRLLDDDARRPRFVETIPKRGYRVVAGALREAVPRAGGGCPHPSIVVLPFVDMASAHDQEYFCDGLAEELTNGLARVTGLRVVSRTSAFAFKGRAVDAREIGRQLGVGALLEGSVRREGDDVRVTVQLIDVADGFHRWSQRFDRPAGDVFAIEDEIVRAVVNALDVGPPSGREGHRPAGVSVSPAAHDLYLRGRHLSARRHPEALAQALDCFQKAVEAAPTYAAAHAAIGECWSVMGFAGFARPADVFPLGRKAAERALEIDPDSADAHAVLGHEKGTFEWRWAEAEAHFERAIALNPGHALARIWYSHLLTASGRFVEAIFHTERACECDPLSPTMRTTLGLALYYARQFERAEEAYEAVLAEDSSFALAHFHLGRAQVVQGRLEDAVAHYAAAAAIPTALGFLAGSLRRLGRPGRARNAVRELEAAARSRYVGPLAWFAAHAGDLDAQFLWLERAIDAREGSVPLVNTDAGVDHLRADPRFQALLGRLGLPAFQVPSPAGPGDGR